MCEHKGGSDFILEECKHCGGGALRTYDAYIHMEFRPSDSLVGEVGEDRVKVQQLNSLYILVVSRCRPYLLEDSKGLVTDYTMTCSAIPKSTGG